MNCGNVPALIIPEKTPDGTKSARALRVESWSTLSQAADFFDEAKVLATTISQWADHLHMVTDWFMDAVGGRTSGVGRCRRRLLAELTWIYPGTYMAWLCSMVTRWVPETCASRTAGEV